MPIDLMCGDPNDHASVELIPEYVQKLKTDLGKRTVMYKLKWYARGIDRKIEGYMENHSKRMTWYGLISYQMVLDRSSTDERNSVMLFMYPEYSARHCRVMRFDRLKH